MVKSFITLAVVANFNTTHCFTVEFNPKNVGSAVSYGSIFIALAPGPNVTKLFLSVNYGFS
jgi:hypothetical protein